MGIRLSWWGRQRGKAQAVVDRFAALDWPVGMVFVVMDGEFAALKKRIAVVEGAKLA